MNFDKLIQFIMTIVIGAAAIGKLGELQRWVWKSQAHLIYQSRASAWGSPSLFKDRFRNDPQKK